jgi:hypothetical protein
MKNAKAIEAVLALVLLAIILFLIFDKEWLLVAGLIIGVVGSLSPCLATKIEWLWNLLTRSVGYVVSRIMLSSIFYLFLTPIAFLYRYFSKNTFAKRQGDSFFRDREHTFQMKDLKNPW